MADPVHDPAIAADDPLTPEMPSDPSLGSVLAQLDEAGWTGQVAPLEGGSIRCLTCREEFPAAEVEADRVRRLEGVSDPGDMVIVVPVVCPHCRTRAVLVAHYGAEASNEEADVVAALSRRPGSGDDPATGSTVTA